MRSLGIYICGTWGVQAERTELGGKLYTTYLYNGIYITRKSTALQKNQWEINKSELSLPSIQCAAMKFHFFANTVLIGKKSAWDFSLLVG